MIVQDKTYVANPLVSIAIFTYNHRRYIGQCIDSVLMQKTKFDYEIIIADDCSADGVQEILKDYQARYPEKIKLLLQDKNLGLIGNYTSMLHQCRGKYIAQTSGDDFWYDPNKLQKQIDALEKNPHCDLCYTNCYTCDDAGNINFSPLLNNEIPTFESHLLNTGYIAPGSWTYNRRVLDYLDLQDWFTDESLAVALDILHHSKVIFISEPTCVYRVHLNSAATQTNPVKMWKYLYGLFKMQLYYAEKYGMSEEFISHMKIQEYHNKCFAAIEAGDDVFIEEGIKYCKDNGIELKWFVESCKEYVKYKKQYFQIYSSKAYRIGRILLKPLKFLRRK